MRSKGFWNGPVLLVGLLLVAAVAGAGTLPFKPGERLFYEVRWEKVPVAQASLEVGTLTQFKGAPAYHFVFRARTYPVVEFFFPVDGYLEGFTDLTMSRSLWFEKDMLEGRTRRNFWVDFDWDRGVTEYANDPYRKRRFPLPEGTLDMISMLYYARSLSLEKGMTVSRPLNTGKKNLLVRARVIQKEVIVVDGRPWKAFMLAPDIREAGGVFDKSEDPELFLWISADERRIPLRLVSKVWVGSFVIELRETPKAADRLS
ncbi:MAG: DUF3108 domain-containing protein [Desulfobacterales bacterium]|jgi:hypothetical protein